MKALLLVIAILFGQQTGVIIEKTYEGGRDENDLYIVEYSGGHREQIEADDLDAGDFVTVSHLFGQPASVKYISRTEKDW